MRTWVIALSAVGPFAAACGSDGATTPPGAAPVATSSTSAESTAAPVTTSGPTGSAIGTTPGDTVETSPAGTVVLSSSGIATHQFGAARSVVEPWLTAELGPPDIDQDSQHQLAACVQWGCTQGVVMLWPEAGLRVGFADSTEPGSATGEAVLAAWTVSTGDWWPGRVSVVAGPIAPSSQPPIRLSTASGIGLGSAMSDLIVAYPSAVLLAWNDSTFVPNGFYIPDNHLGQPQLEGDLDRPSVTDIQAALNAAGANLAVDGVAGPLTRAALEEFRQTHQVDDWAEVFVMLGLSSPAPSASVVRLSAGQWWWELECGALEAAGITNDC